MTVVHVGAWALVPSKPVTDPQEIAQAKSLLAQTVEAIEAKEVAQHEKTA